MTNKVLHIPYVQGWHVIDLWSPSLTHTLTHSVLVEGVRTDKNCLQLEHATSIIGKHWVEVGGRCYLNKTEDMVKAKLCNENKTLKKIVHICSPFCWKKEEFTYGLRDLLQETRSLTLLPSNLTPHRSQKYTLFEGKNEQPRVLQHEWIII